MPKQVGAILLDTRSIQKYVFSCNRLKTNIGASFLVDRIFTDLMPQILNSLVKDYALKLSTDWTKNDGLKIADDKSGINCEIASIGGGNMLILVDKGEQTSEVCHKIVNSWSRELLLRAPGLKTGAAIGFLTIGGSNDEFKISLDNLFKQLKENQNNILPQVDLPHTGLTLECDYSGKVTSVNAIERQGSEKRFVSQEVAAKMEAFKSADEDYRSILGNEYTFTNELDSLGYKEGESYICIIHIDGNNMGVKFSNARSMAERKELSLHVAKIVKDSFKKLVDSIIAEYATYDAYLDMAKLNKQGSGKKVLPIRPIIIGGDDVTFICPGRVGLIYAKRFIEFVNETRLLSDELHKIINEKLKQEALKKGANTPIPTASDHLSCCGGIAIVPAKYPFFRAYELAEALCSVAKQKSRAHDDSLIDFAILHGDMYPNIDQLRANQYVGVEGKLHYGPYFILKEVPDKTQINDLLTLTEKLREVAKTSQNKVKKLRSVLTQDAHQIAQFLENSDKIRELLQQETGKTNVTAQDFWQKQTGETALKTRYIDAIEIADFLIPELYQHHAKED